MKLIARPNKEDSTATLIVNDPAEGERVKWTILVAIGAGKLRNLVSHSFPESGEVRLKVLAKDVSNVIAQLRVLLGTPLEVCSACQ